MGEDDHESTPQDRRLAIHASPLRAELVRRAIALGWTVEAGGDAPVVVIDLAAGAVATRRDDAAILAIVAGPAEARAAYAAGATHWIEASADDGALATALAFAERHARRVRGLSFVVSGRRAGDAARGIDDPARLWLDVRLRDGVVCALAIALTRFEIVNAAFGRATGDALMAAAQARIEQWAQAEFAGAALIVRRGGAETLVLARSPRATIAAAVARLEVELARAFEAGGAAVNLGSRVGLAESSPGDDAAALLARAHEALAAARASDGATTRVADVAGEMPLDRLAADLHHAIERDEIAILFQPQVALTTGAITGVEALARWEHPLLGSLGADRLFAAAERADLGLALSDHIQRVALAAASGWPAALDRLRVSINVTAADLARPGFVAAFLDRIADSGVARARVTVEIVETGLMADLDRAAAILARLRGAGCRIAIDDFGTGYSSLAYLKALPIDYLKIDRSLTRDITGSDRDRIIVRGVIAIARSLGLETIAEGVESEEERALLAGEGCDLYQGFLCSVPVGSAGLAGLVG